ncbi:MAG: sporulation protein, partial [Clostridia bacterium]|nr:sporulation protein [Clostridia bacterium]
MTSDISGGKHKLSAFLFLILAVSTFISLLLSPDIAIGYARSGLALCARTVIPSLFPCMVLSGLMVELGLPELLSRLFARPMKLLFGISGE